MFYCFVDVLAAGASVGCFDHECFQSEYNVTFEAGTLNSPDSCSSACRANGYLYAGLQGSSCVCSCRPKKTCKRTPDMCGAPCPYTEHYCGGHDGFISIYIGGFFMHTLFFLIILVISFISIEFDFSI